MHSTNLFTIADASYRDELRAKFLADAIPATSFAAGANPIGFAILEDYNYQSSERPNGWPRDSYEWLHSDVYDVAFFYIYDLFYKMCK